MTAQMQRTGVQTFRGIVAATDCDPQGQMTMVGWARAVSDALTGSLAALGVDQAVGATGPSLLESEQRIHVFAPVSVGESIEIVSGLVAVEPRELTFAHLVSSVSTFRSSAVARAWTTVAPVGEAEIDQLSPDLIARCERQVLTESEVFGE